MKNTKQGLMIGVLIVALTIMIGQGVFAEFIPGVSLGAHQIKESFNWEFELFFTTDNTLDFRAIDGNPSQPDFSAYNYRNGNNPFELAIKTFCVNPQYDPLDLYGPAHGVPDGGGLGTISFELSYSGYISYANDITDNNFLTVGAAYLYYLWLDPHATGAGIPGLGYTPMAINGEIGSAIRYLMGYRDSSSYLNSNIESYLLNLSNGNWSYWTQAYDPDKYYTEIGNYCVFVVNVNLLSDGSPGQDFLYMVEAPESYPPGVPEPATILLWTVGTFGAAGVSWNRRRTRMKIPVA